MVDCHTSEIWYSLPEDSAEVVWAPRPADAAMAFLRSDIFRICLSVRSADVECYAVQLYGNFMSFSVPVAVEVRSPQIKFGLRRLKVWRFGRTGMLRGLKESGSLCSGRLFTLVEAVTDLDVSVVVSWRRQPPSRHGLSTVGLEGALDFAALQVQTFAAVSTGVSTSCKSVALRMNIFHGAPLSRGLASLWDEGEDFFEVHYLLFLR